MCYEVEQTRLGLDALPRDSEVNPQRGCPHGRPQPPQFVAPLRCPEARLYRLLQAEIADGRPDGVLSAPEVFADLLERQFAALAFGL